MALFRLPWNYIPDPTRGKPLFFGKIYFGVADQDPLLFPKDVNMIQENGDIVVAPRPIRTNTGGIPVDQIDAPSSVIAIDLTGDYSIAIHDKNDNQVYYFANLTEVTNIIETSLRGAALRLNLDATLIGTVLVTNQSGQLLDDALYLQDTVTGLIYSLPDTIPAGSTVTSNSGTNLVTNNGSFTMHHVWVPVENRFKGNQNWNVAGSTGHPLPSASPYEYPVGAEIAAGRFVIGANLVNATYTGGLFNADSGSYFIEYDGDFTNDFYGIKLADNTIVTTGCALSLVSGKTRLTVDMSLAPAHKFPGLSSEPGVWPDINDDDSERGYRGGYIVLQTAPNVESEFYTDGKIIVRGTASLNQQVVTNVGIGIDTTGLTVLSSSVTAQDSTGGSSYRTSLAGSPSLSGSNIQMVSTWAGNNIPVKFEAVLR